LFKTADKNTFSWSDNIVPNHVTYYTVSAVSVYNSESDMSMLVDTRGNIVVVDENRQSSMVIPAEISRILCKSNNNFNDDININLERKESEETNTIYGVYEIQASRAGNNQVISGFDFPGMVEISFSYNTPSAQDKKQLAVFWDNGTEFVKLGGVVDDIFQTITIKSQRTGRYRIQQSLRAGQFEMVKVWPNKTFTPNGDGVNDEVNFMFENPGGSIVYGEIYDTAGTLINELKPGKDNNCLFWDGKDRNGHDCQKGAYIYRIKAEGKKVIGTIILAR
jgi:gliding motility-associated-like protein